MTEPEGIRLQKVLAAAGVASRRASRRATVSITRARAARADAADASSHAPSRL